MNDPIVQPRWPAPQHRDIGLFTNSSLYGDALLLAAEKRPALDEETLMQELEPRFRGLAERRLLENPGDSQSEATWAGLSRRASSDLVKELLRFGWLEKLDSDSRAKSATYSLTSLGKDALESYNESPQRFRRLVTGHLYKLYTVPGWFIERLWKINPNGQGEIFLPAPARAWQPGSWAWDDNEWRDELTRLTIEALNGAQRIIRGSMPIEQDTWLSHVKAAWEHLSSAQQKTHSSGEKVKRFRPRLRMNMAMTQGMTELLFGLNDPLSRFQDIDIDDQRKYIISPKYPRMLRLWLARLEDMNLLFYTDYLTDLPGRLIFPVSVFRASAPSDFVLQKGIISPSGENLYYHTPSWDEHKAIFRQHLRLAYNKISRRVGTFYVSLLDVRDEVCRALRISAATFEDFISKTLREALAADSRLSISLEADVREDQRSGPHQLRRPVWHENVPFSLIAIADRHVQAK